MGNLQSQNNGQIDASTEDYTSSPEASLSDFEGFGVVYTLLYESLDIKEHHSWSFHCSKLSNVWRKLKSSKRVSLEKIMKEECGQLEMSAERQKSYF